MISTPSWSLECLNFFPLIFWIFTEGEGDGIESWLHSKIFSTLSAWIWWRPVPMCLFVPTALALLSCSRTDGLFKKLYKQYFSTPHTHTQAKNGLAFFVKRPWFLFENSRVLWNIYVIGIQSRFLTITVFCRNKAHFKVQIF